MEAVSRDKLFVYFYYSKSSNHPTSSVLGVLLSGGALDTDLLSAARRAARQHSAGGDYRVTVRTAYADRGLDEEPYDEGEDEGHGSRKEGVIRAYKELSDSGAAVVLTTGELDKVIQ